MKDVTIETSLFGVLKFPNSEGILKDFTLELDDKEIRTSLNIWEDFITSKNIAVVKNFLENIPNLYEKAINEIDNNKAKNDVIMDFIESALEEMDEEALLEIFDVDSVDEITTEIFVQILEPRQIWIAPTSSGDIDCTFDFSLPEEYSDQLLVLRFDSQLDLTDISHES